MGEIQDVGLGVREQRTALASKLEGATAALAVLAENVATPLKAQKRTQHEGMTTPVREGLPHNPADLACAEGAVRRTEQRKHIADKPCGGVYSFSSRGRAG